MGTNVNQIIDKAVGQVRSILVQAVEQVDEEARAGLIAQFNQTVGGSKITTVKARAVARAQTKKSAPKAKKSTGRAVKAKVTDKPKRVVSPETKKKLALNLAKARAAKAEKAKTEGVTPKKNGRASKNK